MMIDDLRREEESSKEEEHRRPCILYRYRYYNMYHDRTSKLPVDLPLRTDGTL